MADDQQSDHYVEDSDLDKIWQSTTGSETCIKEINGRKKGYSLETKE